MKRLGIFLIYDIEGIVDEYVFFLLGKMRSAYDELVIVCNCHLKDCYVKRLNAFSGEIYERENKGFDAGGFKDALNDLIGWERARTFDEVILFNDSFFGPFFPITEVFDSMAKRNLDFWSMTKINASINDDSAIQSYFVVVRNRLLHSSCFEEYWRNLPYYEKFEEAVHKYEMKFAEYFEKNGFLWDAYIDSDRYSTIGKSKKRVSLYHTVPYEIMDEQRYPFLKRKLFDLSAVGNKYGLEKQTHENLLLALDYIKDKTDYNMSYIWDNVLRTYSLRNIQDCFCTTKVIESQGEKHNKHKVKVVAWLKDQPATYKNIYRIFSQLEQEDIFIGTEDHNLACHLNEQYKSCTVREYQSTVLFLKGAMEDIKGISQRYESVIFFIDKTCEPSEDEYYVTRMSAIWNRWENIFGEQGYIDRVQSYFEGEKHIGMLVAPKLLHAKYISEGYINETIVEHGGLFKVSNLMQRSKYLADWSESFWIKSDIVDETVALQILNALDNGVPVSDIAKILPYICQKKKFLTQTIESSAYSAIYERMQAVYIRNFMEMLDCDMPDIVNGLDYLQIRKMCDLKKLNEYNVRNFVMSHEQVYIYGCGEIADLLCRCNLVDNLCGFIVSDGKRKTELFFGKPVFELSEIEVNNENGVIVALTDKYVLQIKNGLVRKFAKEHVMYLTNGYNL